MTRAVRIALLAGALALATGPTALAQDGSFTDDGTSEGLLRADENDRFDGPGSLQEASDSGTAYRIGSGGGARNVPELYTVQRGDTLWDVTGRFYGDPWSWPRVWSYNPEVTNPHWIYPLDRLRLLPAGQTSTVVAPQHGGPRVVRASRPRTQGVLLREEGFLDADALRESGEIVGSREDHMLLSPNDVVYVRFEGRDDRGVRPGQEWTVYQEIPSDDRNSAESGTLVRIFGTVRVDHYDAQEHVARATILEEVDPIERGYRIAAIPQRFDDVPARRNDRDLDAQIVASLRPRNVIGEQQIVFLDVGAQDGVQVGNSFFVLEAGDRWRRENDENNVDPGMTTTPPTEPAHYPDEPVAELRVVDVRPHTCTAFVTRTVTHEFDVGMRVAMRRGN